MTQQTSNPQPTSNTNYTAAASRFLTSELGTSGILVLLPDGNFLFHTSGRCINLDEMPKNSVEFDACILEAAQALDEQ